MTELSPEARALIEAARAEERPSSSDKARVLASLIAVLPPPAGPFGSPPAPPTSGGPPAPPVAVGVGAGAAAVKSAALGGGAAKAAVAGTAAVALKVKVVMVVAAVSAGGAGAWLTVRSRAGQQQSAVPAVAQERAQPRAVAQERHERRGKTVRFAGDQPALAPAPGAGAYGKRRGSSPPRPASAVQQPSADVLQPKEIVAAGDEPGLNFGTASSSTAPTGKASIVSAQPPPVAPDPAKPQPSCSTHDELALLSEAQAALQRGQAEQALSLLGRHAGCPGAVFAQERHAVRVLALCQLHRVAEAEQEARALRLEAPHSPHLGRLRNSCAAAALSRPAPAQ